MVDSEEVVHGRALERGLGHNEFGKGWHAERVRQSFDIAPPVSVDSEVFPQPSPPQTTGNPGLETLSRQPEPLANKGRLLHEHVLILWRAEEAAVGHRLPNVQLRLPVLGHR